MLLKEIKLKTNHLSVLYNFYKEVLELNTIYANKKSITVTAGRSNLVFEETQVDINPFYHFAFNVPSNKFEEAFNWMKNKVELLWLKDYNGYIADFTNWHAQSFYFPDPAGNILEFIARFDMKDIVEEKFSSVHVRNVSEIGLVFPSDNFQDKVNKLLQRYPLPYFDKQPPLPQFKAIGDDEGLFIIVPENRIWFATENRESKIFPLEITFIQNDKLSCLKT